MLLEINLALPPGKLRVVRHPDVEKTGRELIAEAAKAGRESIAKRAAERAQRVKAEVLEWIKANPGHNGKQAFDALEIEQNLGKKAIKALSAEGLIVRPCGHGWVYKEPK